MSILGSIFGKIFGRDRDKDDDKARTPQPRPTTTPTPQTPASPIPTRLDDADVEAILDRKLAEKGQELNWRTSIVDLMKLLDIDSSLAARKELAQELNYTGDMNDSASMNIWLHRQVMTRLAQNGGRVPANLRD